MAVLRIIAPVNLRDFHGIQFFPSRACAHVYIQGLFIFRLYKERVERVRTLLCVMLIFAVIEFELRRKMECRGGKPEGNRTRDLFSCTIFFFLFGKRKYIHSCLRVGLRKMEIFVHFGGDFHYSRLQYRCNGFFPPSKKMSFSYIYLGQAVEKVREYLLENFRVIIPEILHLKSRNNSTSTYTRI